MACAEKIRYATQAHADAACKQWAAKVKAKRWGRDSKRLNAYLCKECGFFHVGRIGKRKPTVEQATEPARKIPSTGELKRRLKRLDERLDKERRHRAYLIGQQVETDKRLAELHDEMQQAQRETLALFGMA